MDEPPTLIFKTLTATQDPFVNALWTPTPIIPPTLETTFTVPALQAPFTTQIVDTFDNGTLAIWRVGTGWVNFQNLIESALAAQGATETVSIAYTDIDTVAFQVRVNIERGTFRLFIWDSAQGAYNALLYADGAMAQGDCI